MIPVLSLPVYAETAGANLKSPAAPELCSGAAENQLANLFNRATYLAVLNSSAPLMMYNT